MNIIGEYTIKYKIYTMFDVFDVEIKNNNLITENGYEFFLEKWYKDELYPIQLGYYHNNKFFEEKNIDDTYSYELTNSDGSYTTSMNYIDKDTYKQYKFDGENFVDFNEKLYKICLGNYEYLDDNRSKPLSSDVELYNPLNEYVVDDDGFILKSNELIMKCTLNKEDIDGTTEIGVKTNHGRLVSHDIHAPYNLAFGNDISLQYVFKLKKEE